jgi:mannose-6-phosphate isomerase
MHLLEAFLALSEASGRACFARSTMAVAEVAKARFVDPSSGALLEYFTDELQPARGAEGSIAEPGHCFEWAWLFERLAASGWSEGTALSDRLVQFARAFGIDASRGVAINEVLADGTPHNASARLWPQTERLKAAAIRYRVSGEITEAIEATAALAGLRQYWDVEVRGLWRDKLKPDCSWVDEPAPGSSLYHISCAIAELSLAS